MLLHSIYFFGGLVGLYFGAEWLIKGASLTALKFGVRPLLVGLTVVALGTSMPEVIVTVTAALQNSPDVGLGNVVGSNIANIALILGAASLVAPLTVSKGTLHREYLIMVAFSVLVFGLAIDGTISRIDGGILLAGAVSFTAWAIISSLRHKRDSQRSLDTSNINTEVTHEGILADDEVSHATEVVPNIGDTSIAEEVHSSMRRNLVLILVGFAGLIAGAHFLITGAIYVARNFGISEIVIGLSLVAIGTSLPELATSLIAAARDESDICIGNVIGSNIYNIGLVLGFLALITPLQVGQTFIREDLPIMLAFTILLYPLIRWKYKITRSAGIALLLGYGGVIYYVFAR